MQKKKRSSLKTWSIAVGTGTFMIGAGVYLGLNAAMKHNSLAQPDMAVLEIMPVANDSQNMDESAPELIDDTDALQLSDDSFESDELGLSQDAEMGQQPVLSDELAETDSAESVDQQAPVGESAPQQPQELRPEPSQQAPADRAKRFQRAPAPAPSAAVRLASGEEVMLPADKRIDQFLASRDGSRMDDYIEQVYTSGPAAEPGYYPPRPSN